MFAVRKARQLKNANWRSLCGACPREVLQSLKIGTKRFRGTIDASSDARITGVGALYVPPRGCILIVH